MPATTFKLFAATHNFILKYLNGIFFVSSSFIAYSFRIQYPRFSQRNINMNDFGRDNHKSSFFQNKLSAVFAFNIRYYKFYSAF